ncbi:AtpZ/AtpI family protein [Oecophyllibacter saccharovorans]|nr:AtpZ/AtpI family protein [Oecophyllibacter saccharovorans]
MASYLRNWGDGMADLLASGTNMHAEVSRTRRETGAGLSARRTATQRSREPPAMTQPESSETRAFDARLTEAQKRLLPGDAKALEKAAANKTPTAFGMAMRVASDMIAGVILGAAIGVWLDRETGHKPLFTLLFALLGFGAGMRNVWRVVNTPVSETDSAADAEKNGSGKRGKD